MTSRVKFRVPLYGNLNRAALIPIGAQLGTDLLMPDGKVATLQSLAAALQPYLTTVAASSSGGVGGLSTTLWQLIQDIPANIVEAAALSTTGLVTRKSDGNWITSTIEGSTGRIVVTHGDGDAGDPVIDLASFSGLSVLGVAGTSSAKPAAIVGALHQFLQVAAGPTLKFDYAYLGTSLADVVIGTPAVGDTLIFDGSHWVNGPGVPLTDTGDILSFQYGEMVRIPIGPEGYVLTVFNGFPTWIPSGGFAAPTITLLSPDNADQDDPNTPVDITGTDFTTFTTVTFNGVSLTPVTFVDDMHISVVVPSTQLTTPGTYDVVATNPIGQDSAPEPFTVNPPPPPDSPLVLSVTSTAGSVDSTSLTFTLPTRNTGDLLIAVVSHRDSTLATFTGWTQEVADINGGVSRLAVYSRVATGSDPNTITFTSGSTKIAVLVYRIQASSFQGDIEGSSNNGSADPPNLTPSWGSAKNLWIVGLGDINATTVSVYPLADNQTRVTTTAGGNACMAATASVNQTATSLNPTAFTVGSSFQPITCTVAVRPV